MIDEIAFDSSNTIGRIGLNWETPPPGESLPSIAEAVSSLRSSNRRLRGSFITFDYSSIRRESDLKLIQNSLTTTPALSAETMSSTNPDDIAADLKGYFFDKMEKKGIKNAKRVYDEYLKAGFSPKAAIALTDRRFFPKPHEKNHGVYLKKVIGDELFKKEQAARKGKKDWIEKTSSAAFKVFETSTANSKAPSGNLKKYKYQQEGSVGGYLLGIAEIIAGGAIIATGTALEVVTLGGFTIGFGVTLGTGMALIGTGLATTTVNSRAFDRTLPPTTWKISDVYVPDRPLPRDPRTGLPKPETNAPHTELGTRNGDKGKYPQAREFDDNGKPVRDIDFTDHGRPEIHLNPHEHPYIKNPTGGTLQRDDGQEFQNWGY